MEILGDMHTTAPQIFWELLYPRLSGIVHHQGKYQVTQDSGRCLSPPFLAAGEAWLSLHSYSGSWNLEKSAADSKEMCVSRKCVISLGTFNECFPEQSLINHPGLP